MKEFFAEIFPRELDVNKESLHDALNEQLESLRERYIVEAVASSVCVAEYSPCKPDAQLNELSSVKQVLVFLFCQRTLSDAKAFLRQLYIKDGGF